MANGAETGVPKNWTSMQAYVMAVICLVVGVALGYLLRGSEPGAVSPSQAPQTASA